MNLVKFTNIGNVCHFNSLIQALLSCPILNHYLISERANGTLSPIANEYLAIIDNSVPDKYIIASTQGMLQHLSAFTPGRQQDVQEGLMEFLNALKNVGAERLFQIEYINYMHCQQCNHETTPVSSVEIMIDMPTTLSSQRAIEQYIQEYKDDTPDYKCEGCAAVGTVYKVSKLKRLPSILVIIFKKYERKHEQYFSERLEILHESSIYRYQLVAQIEHSGNTAGGHYSANCLRVKPTWLHARRIECAKSMIEKHKNTDTPRARECIAKLQRLLAIEDMIANESKGVFHMDDMRISFLSSGFTPTRETYLVFYSLLEKL